MGGGATQVPRIMRTCEAHHPPHPRHRRCGLCGRRHHGHRHPTAIVACHDGACRCRHHCCCRCTLSLSAAVAVANEASLSRRCQGRRHCGRLGRGVCVSIARRLRDGLESQRGLFTPEASASGAANAPIGIIGRGRAGIGGLPSRIRSMRRGSEWATLVAFTR